MKITDNIIAFCGLVCSACPAYLATQKDDDGERREVAKTWSKQYSVEIKAGDINCNGCTSQAEPLFNYCKVCEIRRCGKEKGIQNCAWCDEYACDRLSRFFDMASDARRNLDVEKKKHGLKT